MWSVNPTWGSPRIRDELTKLGLQASTATIRKYRPKSGRRPSQSWRTFLQNHAGGIAAMDFFVVPTVTCRLLYVLVVVAHERRKVIHFNITQAPTAEWTAQQVVNAFPYGTAPKYLLRDRDSVYGSVFVRRVEGMGIEQKLISPRSPWQSPYVELLKEETIRTTLTRTTAFSVATDFLPPTAEFGGNSDAVLNRIQRRNQLTEFTLFLPYGSASATCRYTPPPSNPPGNLLLS